MRLTESKFLKLISVILFVSMIIWGVANIYYQPYEVFSFYMGIVQIVLGAIILAGIFVLR